MLIPAAVATVTCVFTATIGVAQVVPLPSQQQEARCVAEEQQRDQLALRRFGQRTRDLSEIREYCRAEVIRRFDDRVLGRPSLAGPPPIGRPTPIPAPSGRPGTSTGAVGSLLSIGGVWHHAATDSLPDNRVAYFIETSLIERGPITTAWLTGLYERPVRGREASSAFRVRIECATGRWAYQYIAVRDAALRVLGVTPPDNGWRAPITAPHAPIALLRSAICEGASPGTPVPTNVAPADWARNWFAQNPR
jgi:hypothetical protein